jgi:hypothetical protein
MADEVLLHMVWKNQRSKHTTNPYNMRVRYRSQGGMEEMREILFLSRKKERDR